MGILRTENRDFGGDSPADITRAAEAAFFVPAVALLALGGGAKALEIDLHGAEDVLFGGGLALTVVGLLSWIGGLLSDVPGGNFRANPGNARYTPSTYDDRY